MRGIRKTTGERIGHIVIITVLLIVSFITLYPLLYVLSMSLSDKFLVARKQIFLLPKGISLDAFKVVLEKPDVWQSYYNTVWYTVVGTCINIVMTILIAYPLSRKHFILRNQLTIMIALTMWFHGGLIPTFLLIKSLGLYNTRWVMVIPTAVAAWNVIITRTFFQENMPDELAESAKIDGANDLRILFNIVVPLSKAIIAVNVLFYGVQHWNAFFNAMIYLPNKKLQPIQLFLRSVLIENLAATEDLGDVMDTHLIAEKLKYAVIIFAMLPIMMVYPFLQKYFVKGVMIGSIKG